MGDGELPGEVEGGAADGEQGQQSEKAEKVKEKVAPHGGNVIQLKVNSESQHTETVKKIVCAGFYAKKGNGKKAEKGIREKDYANARNYDTL